MGFFSRKKNTMPVRNMTANDIQQNRINMQSEIDKLDFQLAKKKRQAELRRTKSNRGLQIKHAIQDFGDALDAFDDGALRDPVGDKRKKHKPIIDDPFGKMRF